MDAIVIVAIMFLMLFLLMLHVTYAVTIIVTMSLMLLIRMLDVYKSENLCIIQDLWVNWSRLYVMFTTIVTIMLTSTTH